MEKGHSMVSGVWGKKIGMAQVFSDSKVVPVTVIDASNWYVTQIKTEERDGYFALQVSQVKEKFIGQSFSNLWLKQPKKYFAFMREIRLKQSIEGAKIGQILALDKVLAQGDVVDVFGKTKGCGFAGVVKRHGFYGGRGSHGDKTGRRTGSVGAYRAQGRVIKGKKMAGHMGNEQRATTNLEVVKVGPESHIMLIKGSVPGKSGSLVFIRKKV
jgi:large subunit ribosomal protein L3